MKILILNTGSSSIKFQVFQMPEQNVLAVGMIEKIGEEQAGIRYKWSSNDQEYQIREVANVPDHNEGLSYIVEMLLDKEKGVIKTTEEIEAVGHRVVHGSDQFSRPTLVTDEVLRKLETFSYLAPLHNPACILGIQVAKDYFNQAKQVAVFDTAFHQSMPEYVYRYAIPANFYEDHGLRAYGFHGTSHQFVMKSAAGFLDLPLRDFNTITIHLGNGCSIAAIRGGKCVDTSMGLTPMGGLIMGTRSGDIDPSLLLFLGQTLEMSFQEIDHLLNKQSGLKGVAGTNDLRTIIQAFENGDKDAKLATLMYVYRIRKYLGAYAVTLGRLDALIFTAGVGENSAYIREQVCKDLEIIGIRLDEEKNRSSGPGIRSIESEESRVKVLVVPTNEELEIASQAYDLLSS
jgi:acetate kinase